MPRLEPSQARRHFSSADGTPGRVPSLWSGQDQNPTRVRPISRRRQDPRNCTEVARPTAPPTGNFTELAKPTAPLTGNFTALGPSLRAKAPTAVKS